jgi:hypothetical protein
MVQRTFMPLALIVCTSIIIGCGTTHQFIPVQPLEREKWQLSIVWHYDFSRNIKATVMPDLHAYMGIGRNYNFGFGAQLPFFISHVTFAKYYKTGAENYWTIYGTANQVFSLYNNPYLEIGGQYCSKQDKYYSCYSAGVAYGQGFAIPGGLFTMANVKNNDRKISQDRIIPFVKAGIFGRDFGVSYSHYHGLTHASVAGLQRRLSVRNDTLYSFQASEIDSIRQLNDHRYIRYHESIWGFFLPNGDTLILLGPLLPPDVGGPMLIPFIYNDFNEFWKSRGYVPGTIFIAGHGRAWATDYKKVVLDPNQIKHTWESGTAIAITEYPDNAIRQIDKNSFECDHSIGLGIITYPHKH